MRTSAGPNCRASIAYLVTIFAALRANVMSPNSELEPLKPGEQRQKRLTTHGVTRALQEPHAGMTSPSSVGARNTTWNLMSEQYVEQLRRLNSQRISVGSLATDKTVRRCQPLLANRGLAGRRASFIGPSDPCNACILAFSHLWHLSHGPLVRSCPLTPSPLPGYSNGPVTLDAALFLPLASLTPGLVA